MEGFLEGIIGGLVSMLGFDLKKMKPWWKALAMLILFWVVGIPLLLIFGNITFSTLLTPDVWIASLALYLAFLLLELLCLVGKHINESKEENSDDE